MFIIFDTETTGLPDDYNAPVTNLKNWPRLVQLAWQVHAKDGSLISNKNYIIKPEGFEIPYETIKVHGITNKRAEKYGHDLKEVLLEFAEDVKKYDFLVGHNVDFDNKIVGAEFFRKELDYSIIFETQSIDTKNLSTEYCAIPGKGKGFKWPSLNELHLKLFNENFEEAHNAAADVEATARCFLELIRIGVIGIAELKWTNDDLNKFREKNPERVKPIGLNIEAYDDEELQNIKNVDEDIAGDEEIKTDINFTHLHLHSQFSILDGLTNIKELANKAAKDNMTAVAITDHGNMFGVKEFHKELNNNGLKPIIGSEVYIAQRSHLDKQKQDSSSYHLVLLAKNEQGYKNLIKLSSIGFIDGFYYKPRIDKDLLKKYSEGLIAMSACLAGEISQKIMKHSVEEAEKTALEYKDIFGDDFYIEIQRHKTNIAEMNHEVYKDQVFVNEKLIGIAKKHNIKYVATNDVHFLNADDYLAHDRLICLNTGKDIDDPKRLKYTGQEWFKTKAEMAEIFADIPEALENTEEINSKIEIFELNKAPIMPEFPMPDEFKDYDEYLRHVTYQGAKNRWGDLNESITKRLDFELETIKKMKYPSYFLIVWDFLKAARDLGVIVGPGRGSAAGSAVAYCLQITDIDPLKYNLLFERFLNPDRVSMPDIDIDFDDDGRDKILQWVKDKYGSKRVAHIITFGTMAAKLSIRDVSRVQKLPLSEADRLAKLVPDKPGSTLKAAYKDVPELKDEIEKGRPEVQSVLEYAEKMEGSVRNTGTHACGVIIGRDDLDKYIPISTVKDSMLEYSTQYDGKYVEDVGLLKMDFLGLKTLTIIKETIENIKLSKGEEVDISKVPLDDKETYKLYARGETTGLFQFESPGMQKSLRELKPTHFEDLIAMNALYRPGPMEYIPNFIARKNGKEKIEYDLPEMEEYLDDTYGITVYQEQVMLLSRKLANFTRGMSDSLRKAMGKKKKDMMDELYVKFMEGCEKNGHDKKIAEKIWKDWEEFAKYAFNKSHATCYSYVSFQTGFLKAHYPAEFMAAVLSHNLKDIKKLTFYLNEVNRMGIKVLGPDVNESFSNFTVNKDGNLRYGMAGIKGVGEAAVKEIIRERNENGAYKSVFDLVKRVNLRTVNRKSMEALAKTGGFDNIGENHRAQFFFKTSDEDSTFLEKIIYHGQKYQQNKNSAQASLFGETTEDVIQEPEFPQCEKWTPTRMLKDEKNLIGFYLSGHPLDNYNVEFNTFIKHSVEKVKEKIAANKRGQISFGGMITEASHRKTKNDKPFGNFSVEDKTAELNVFLFGEDYLKYRHLIEAETAVFINATITKSFRNEEESDLRINSISLLDDLIEKNKADITLLLDADNVDDVFVENFGDFILSNQGESALKLRIKSKKQGSINFRSKYKVNTKAVLSRINEFPDVKYRLKSKN